MGAMSSAGEKTRVLVHGAAGRMGREVLAAVLRQPDMLPVALVDRVSPPAGSVPHFADVMEAIRQTRPRVTVDFSTAEGAMQAARAALPAGVCLVVGSTGLSDGELEEIRALCSRHEVGAVVAPNFALGAVLLVHMARTAARFFDYADIVEMHHETKIDAPSGTALAIARAMAEAKGQFQRPMPQKEPVPGTRGGEQSGVSIHSVRMPGRMAHHEVTLGTSGQTLTLRHDTINRECYIPGVMLAIRDVTKRRGLVVGLEKVLGL
ncbi:MAG: 4-hydroxy-tetrahydrodipicolinate reductase [Chloroflexi bacterium]|nr:4-hydroxy-tetrahydrodipicolinate reductase [Chloroflexota bacterium]